MTKPNSEIRELSMDEMDMVSGGSVEIKELVIKAVVSTDPPPPAPTPIPLPNIRIRF